MEYLNNHHRFGPHISIPTPTFYDPSHHSAYQTLKLPHVKDALRLPTVTEASRVPPVMESYEIKVGNVRPIIHSIELEAYAAVLKAFKAQSDLLSWGKEELITELRKELNVTDEEHIELLMRINSDKSIKIIRELRQGIIHSRGLPSSVTYAPGFGLNSASCAPCHSNLKLANANVSTMQRFMAHVPPIPVPTPPLLLPNWDGSGNRELSTCYSRCPEQPMRVVFPSFTKPSESKYGGPVQPQPKNPICVPEVHYVEKKSRIIKICATETVLSKVQDMVYGRENPSPDQMEKAKSILMEQERAILEALEKLADVTNEDHSSQGYQDQLESQKELTIMGELNSREHFCQAGYRVERH